MSKNNKESSSDSESDEKMENIKYESNEQLEDGNYFNLKTRILDHSLFLTILRKENYSKLMHFCIFLADRLT